MFDWLLKINTFKKKKYMKFKIILHFLLGIRECRVPAFIILHEIKNAKMLYVKLRLSILLLKNIVN